MKISFCLILLVFTMSKIRTSDHSGRTDSPKIRTSIIGQLAEDSYRESMGESGTGSDARRKAIIRRCFADRTLFASIGRELKRKLADLARDFQSKVIAAFVNRIAIIQEDLNTLRNGNAMEEADDHPAFRGRVERALAEMLR
ncbi:hypothetical protein E6O75_ATG03480 [Venturia nashicola]|uniref:DUF7605 domain-containing protein n=1 Tax=Venturia nashicola TaxID=86259 RepID=A0A4Z1P8J8_9PEZI|nr:hypothetical protein E6O75_ATG03480 [Venturia nashicola]